MNYTRNLQSYSSTQRKPALKDLPEPLNSAKDAFASSWWASPVQTFKESFEAISWGSFLCESRRNKPQDFTNPFWIGVTRCRWCCCGISGGVNWDFLPTLHSKLAAWFMPTLTPGSKPTKQGRWRQQTIASEEKKKAGTHHRHLLSCLCCKAFRYRWCGKRSRIPASGDPSLLKYKACPRLWNNRKLGREYPF